MLLTKIENNDCEFEISGTRTCALGYLLKIFYIKYSNIKIQNTGTNIGFNKKRNTPSPILLT